MYHGGATLAGGHYSAVCCEADGDFFHFVKKTRLQSGCVRVSEDAVERQLLNRMYLMVYVRAGGSAVFADMAEAPASPKRLDDEHAARMGAAAAAAAVCGTPTRAAAGRSFPAVPPAWSCETTPSCAPPRKRICVECKGEFDDVCGQMSVATGSGQSMSARSPPVKCLKCTPGRLDTGSTYMFCCAGSLVVQLSGNGKGTCS